MTVGLGEGEAGLTGLEEAGTGVTAAGVDTEALAPPCDAAEPTAAPTGTSAAEPSMMIDTATAIHATLLRDVMGSRLTPPRYLK